MSWLTWRIGAFLLFGLLAAVSGVGIYDGIVNRTELRLLRGDKKALTEMFNALNQNVGTCHANVANLHQSVKDQGKDIRDLAKATKDNGDQAKADMARLVTQGKGVAAEVSRIGKLPPPTPQNACTDSERVLRGQL